MITAVDETVFNVTTSLKQAGLWENTLLIWTTVHLRNRSFCNQSLFIIPKLFKTYESTRAEQLELSRTVWLDVTGHTETFVLQFKIDAFVNGQDNGAEITHQLPGCGTLHPIPSISGVGGSPGYCGGGSNAPFRGGKGERTALFVRFYIKMYHFTKTGSGQT